LPYWAKGEADACPGGIPGLPSSDVCCPTTCGSCGGTGCSGRNGGDGFTGSEACCVLGVRTLERTCSAEISAPCVVSEGVRARNGVHPHANQHGILPNSRLNRDPSEAFALLFEYACIPPLDAPVWLRVGQTSTSEEFDGNAEHA